MEEELERKNFSIDVLTELAFEAADIQREYFSLDGPMAFEVKADETPLTIADTSINDLVITRIQDVWPGVGVRAEEKSILLDGDYEVSCDPVDGTIPFVMGIPTATFSIALLERGVPIMAAVAHSLGPEVKILQAEQGKGVRWSDGGEGLKVLPYNDLLKAAVGIVTWKGCGYHMREVCDELDRRGVGTINTGSIVHMASLVAAGKLHATIFPGVYPHDSSAVALMVKEAGGLFTDIHGNEQRYDGPVMGHVAANPDLHPQLIEIIREVQAAVA